MRHLSVVLALLAGGAGCARDGETGADPECGEGRRIELAEGPGCHFGAPIIETGFRCPADFPVERRVDDGVVCAAGEQAPGERPPEERAPREPEPAPPAAPAPEVTASRWERAAGGETSWVCVPERPEAERWLGCMLSAHPDPVERGGHGPANDRCVSPPARVRVRDGFRSIDLRGRCEPARFLRDDAGGLVPIPDAEVTWHASLHFAADLPRDVALDLRTLGEDQLYWETSWRRDVDEEECPVPLRERPAREGGPYCPAREELRVMGSPAWVEAPDGVAVLSADHVRLEIDGAICGRGWSRFIAGGTYEHCVDYWQDLLLDHRVEPGGVIRRNVTGTAGYRSGSSARD